MNEGMLESRMQHPQRCADRFLGYEFSTLNFSAF